MYRYKNYEKKAAMKKDGKLEDHLERAPDEKS
jgi:hypothetical protein